MKDYLCTVYTPVAMKRLGCLRVQGDQGPDDAARQAAANFEAIRYKDSGLVVRSTWEEPVSGAHSRGTFVFRGVGFSLGQQLQLSVIDVLERERKERERREQAEAEEPLA